MNTFIRLERRYPKMEILAYLIIVLTVILTNIWIIKSPIFNVLMGDDLVTWSQYNTRSSFDFIFSTSDNKFRPIYFLVSMIIFNVFGSNLRLILFLYILIWGIISLILFKVFCAISNNLFISLFLSLIIATSRFSIYFYTQQFGIMEQLAFIFSFLSLFFFWDYIMKSQKMISLILSVLFFNLTIYTHERYLSMYLIFIIGCFLINNYRQRLYIFILSTITIFSNLLLKILININPFEGTKHTNILQTFDIKNIILNFIKQICYLLQINLDFSYLNGINILQINKNQIIIICMYILSISFYFLYNFILNIRMHKDKEYILINKSSILFISYIISCMAINSVTVMLEIRWLVTLLAGVAMLICINYKQVKISKNINFIATILLYFSFILYFVSTSNYRSNMENIYFLKAQKAANDIYEQTILKYGDNLLNKKIDIITSNDDLKWPLLGDGQLFFQQFNKTFSVNYINIKDYDYTQNVENIILLEYNGESGHVKSSNIKNDLRNCKLIKGWYEWEENKSYIWMSNYSEILISTKNNGITTLSGAVTDKNLPNNLDIYIDGSLVNTFAINEKNFNLEINVPKNKIISLGIKVHKTFIPKELGISDDIRELGAYIEDIVSK